MAAPLKSILYIEDEPDIQTVAKLALEMVGGYVVHTAGSGIDGLKRYQQLQPDLVLLDVMMPGMDGPQTLEAIRALPPGRGQVVIFITAKAQPAEVRHYLSLGVAGVIQKPFDPLMLSAEVQQLWLAAQRLSRS